MRNFIPKPYKKEPITIRIETETLEKIDAIISAGGGLSRSGFICQCIEYAIENMASERYTGEAVKKI